MSGAVTARDTDDDGCTLLHRAAAAGLRSLCEGLLRDFGADVAAAAVGGDTALHLAWAAGRKDVAKLLERLGADPLAVNGAGFAAVDLRRDV